MKRSTTTGTLVFILLAIVLVATLVLTGDGKFAVLLGTAVLVSLILGYVLKPRFSSGKFAVISGVLVILTVAATWWFVSDDEMSRNARAFIVVITFFLIYQPFSGKLWRAIRRS